LDAAGKPSMEGNWLEMPEIADWLLELGVNWSRMKVDVAFSEKLSKSVPCVKGTIKNNIKILNMYVTLFLSIRV